MSTTAVNCVIIKRVWTPPAQPSSCTGGWGNLVVLGRSGLPAFTCGAAVTSTPVKAPVIADGSDDTVGQFTCQVRTFGVDCFDEADGSGLFISRTGYSIY